MLKDISKFYNSVKVKKKGVIPVNKDQIPPITFVKVFHKEYPRLPSINLPEVYQNEELEKIMKDRKSTRTFSKNALELKDLSLILNGCKVNEREGFFERRAYPSAGARFPVEIYLMSFNVKGLPGGAYHYNSDKNSLEVLLKKDLTDFTADFASPFIQNPALVFLMTSVISRSEVKYGNKAYPFSLLEAGHIGQNISLLCAKYKIGCCAIGGYVDETVSKTLDITKGEIPIYSLALGKIDEDKRN